MTLKKINLSALHTTNTNQTSTEIWEASTKWEFPWETEIKKENDRTTLPVEETPLNQISPVKISLKQLKKTTDETPENKNNSENTPEIKKDDIVSWVSSQSETIDNPLQEKKLFTMKKTAPLEAPMPLAETNETPISPQVNNISEKQSIDEPTQNTNSPTENISVTEKLNIADWDTNCNIIVEDKKEIFWSYKWSFIKEKKEDIISMTKNKIEKTQEVFSIQESVIVAKEPISNTQMSPSLAELWEQNSKDTIQKTPLQDTSKTHLEKYSIAKSLTTKFKKQKFILAWVVSWLSLSIWWLLFFQWNLIKWNIQEIDVIPTTQSEILSSWENIQPPKENITVAQPIENIPSTPIENIPPAPVEIINLDSEIWIPTNDIPQPTHENIQPPITEPIMHTIPEIDNSQIWNTEIVKENTEVQVENIEKSGNINEKLHNFLREKYKK